MWLNHFIYCATARVLLCGPQMKQRRHCLIYYLISDIFLGVLRSVEWLFAATVSGQTIFLIFKGETVREVCPEHAGTQFYVQKDVGCDRFSEKVMLDRRVSGSWTGGREEISRVIRMGVLLLTTVILNIFYVCLFLAQQPPSGPWPPHSLVYHRRCIMSAVGSVLICNET